MSPLDIFNWLAHSWFAALMQASDYSFATVEVFHLLGLAFLGGALLVLALKVFGVLMPEQPLQTLARGLAPILITALVVTIVSGVLLVADGPLRYYANVAFRTKMALLLGGLTFGWLVYRALGNATPAGLRTLRTATAVVLFLWLGVGLAGRAIGLL